MPDRSSARRTYGTGGLVKINDTYYGKWRIGDRQIKRRLGPVRKPGTREGLTKRQAEAKLRTLMAEISEPPVTERLTVTEVGERLLAHLEAMGRKPSTIRSYRSNLRANITPRLGSQSVGRVRREEVEEFVFACLRARLAPKTVDNCLGQLHGIFEHAVRRGWATVNPCKYVDRPKAVASDTDIRFLDQAEVEALLQAVPDDDFGWVQQAIYLAATMSGLRQGELLALRWMDVDWSAQRIRVRRNLVAGEFGTPKSRRGSRSVPLADRLGGELDRLYRRSAYQAETDLVFANPHTGRPMNGTALLRSYQRALKAAGVRQVRFHDLRHTFGTRMAAAGVPMRTLQEWMGHRDLRTTLIYADYAPSEHEVDLVNDAFREPNADPTRPMSTNVGTNLSQTQTNSEPRNPVNTGVIG